VKHHSVFFLVALEPQSMKVFNIKEWSEWWSLSLRSLGRETMGSQHLLLGALLFTGAMKKQRQLSTGQSNYTNSWLAALLRLALSFSLYYSVSLHLNLSLSRRVIHSKMQSPFHSFGPFTSSSNAMAPQRTSLSPNSHSGDKYLQCCPDLFEVN